jgi:hypothetical protein
MNPTVNNNKKIHERIISIKRKKEDSKWLKNYMINYTNNLHWLIYSDSRKVKLDVDGEHNNKY